MNLFIVKILKEPEFFGPVALIVIFSICCHEYVHARTALFFGDDTAARTGHLTLNPLRQMGVTSLVMLALVGLAWGQVPVNPANFRRRRDEVLVSLAGPLTNFALALLFIILTAVAVRVEFSRQVCQLLYVGGVYNMILGIFNLLPIPGLDGGNAVALLFPQLFRFQTEFAKGAYFTLVILLFIFFDKIEWLASKAAGTLLSLFFDLLKSV